MSRKSLMPLRHMLTALMMMLPAVLWSQTETRPVQPSSDASADASSRDRDRLVTNAKMVGVAYNTTQDTYLSPERYGGTEVRYVSHTMRERDGTPWLRLILNEGRMAYGRSRSKNGALISGDYHFQYGVLRQWHLLSDRLSLQAGGHAEALCGFMYNTRNGNNPAQARMLVNVGAVARAHYRLSRRVALAYEASVPLVGVTFSPNYGQSYYEIFSEGDYDHNIVPTTVVSMPSLRQTLTADIRCGRTTWRVGYIGDYRQQAVNDLKLHTYTTGLVVGLVHTFTAGRRAPL